MDKKELRNAVRSINNKGVKTIVKRCLAHRILGRRYKNFAEVLADLYKLKKSEYADSVGAAL